MPENNTNVLENYSERSYIKNILIEIPKYRFNHHPLEGESEEQNKYTGRSKIEEQFLEILEKGNKKGAYLISGYRGMGKTSFVKKVVNQYKENVAPEEKIVTLNLSFAQSDLKSEDLLKQLIQAIITKSEESLWIRITNLFSLGSIFRAILFIFFGLIICNQFEIIDLNSFELFKGFNELFNFEEILNKKTTTDSKTSENQPNIYLDKLIAIGALALWISYFLYFARKITLFVFQNIFLPLINLKELILNPSLKNIRRLKKIIKKFIIKILPGLSISFSIYFIIHSILLKEYSGIIFPTLLLLISLLFIKGFLYELIIAEREIIIKLKKLLLRCNASIVEENGFESNFWDKLPFSLSSKNSHAYPIANSKEIENDLIEILAEYKKFNSYKKSFIVIFDELDKVEQTIDKTINYQDFQINKNEGSLNETRDRKITIINILSSLKYFVTEANARFIFIAGREMFDAALADIADRQSFISSIFHNVLYVDSFLKDGSESNNSGLTNLVEDYLSRILLNPYKKEINKTEIPFLKEYYDFLTKSNSHYLLPEYHLSEEEKMKIIFTLQNFIIYITYRSNGSPKKISKIIEDHIVPFNWKAKYESDNEENIKKQSFKYIYVRARKNIRNEEKMLCLKLNYHDQYRFGFISHLFRPFIMNFSQHAKRLSDNVLVAMPYLMDHIIKFHPFAFSNQNLELLPEVISANRNPIVRNFIDELLDYLRQSHLSQTEMGLFDYKFVSKTANEINYISKVFEEESAAFNFSLDEMYAIKVYLNNRIKEIRKNNKEMHGNAIYPSSIYSVSLLQALLGDTHYFDQEFDSAIVAYLDSLQTLRYENHNEVFNQEWLISNIRLKLKIGLIYERIKKYDMAGSYYNDAINEYLHYIKNCSKNLNFTNALDNCLQLVFQALMASLSINEKKSIQGLASETTLKYINKIDDIIRQNNISKSKFLPYSDFYNDLGNLYFYKNLAKKIINNGQKITHSNLINELFTKNNLNIINISLINKDFRVSLESLEYYSISLKNTLGINQSLTLKDTFKEASHNLVNYDNIHDTNSLRLIGYSLSSIGNSFLSVYPSTKSRTSNIQFLIDYSKKWIFINEINKNLINNLLKNDLHTFKIEFEELNGKISIEKLFGKFINDNIQTVLKSKNDSTIKSNQLIKIFSSKKFRPMKFWDIMTEDFFTQDNQSDLELIVFSYYLAGRYYSKSGKTKQLGFQLKKILETLNNCIQKNDLKKSKNEFLKFIEETILSMILEAASWSSMSTDRPQIYKYKNYENLEKLNDGNHIIHPSKYTKHNYFNVSNTPETKEGILAMAMIKTKLTDYNKRSETIEEIKKFVENIKELSLIHSHGSIFTQLTRIVELNLHTRINRIILKNVLKNIPKLSDWESTGSIQYKNYNNKLDKYKIEDNQKFEFICELVASSIFDIIQIIKIFQIYTTNPYLNYSYLAYFHKRLGRWLKYYSLCRLIDKNHGNSIIGGKSKIDKKLAKLFGNSETLITLDSTSQYQIALQYLHKAKEMHSNGIAYHNELNKSIYLEGDFDDHLYHFGIALERQKINSGSLRDEIRDLEKEIVDSPLYKYDSYVNNKKIEI